MALDDWGLEVPTDPLDDVVALLGSEPALPPSGAGAPLPEVLEPSAPILCLNCGEVHSTCRERAVEEARARIRFEARDRLERTEAALGALTVAEKIAAAEWLARLLERPPFANGRVSAPAQVDQLRDLIDALWRDIYWLTPADEDLDLVPGGNELLLAQRPGRYIAP